MSDFAKSYAFLAEKFPDSRIELGEHHLRIEALPLLMMRDLADIAKALSLAWGSESPFSITYAAHPEAVLMVLRGSVAPS